MNWRVSTSYREHEAVDDQVMAVELPARARSPTAAENLSQ